MIVGSDLAAGARDLDPFYVLVLVTRRKGASYLRLSGSRLRDRGACASPRSFITAASWASSFFMVESRPLQPQASVTASLGRRPQVFYNLHAFMQRQRPFASGAVCSRLHVPSDSSPATLRLIVPSLRSSALEMEQDRIVFSL